MRFKFEVGDIVTVKTHAGTFLGTKILRRENLGVPCYWVWNYTGWIFEGNIRKGRFNPDAFEEFYDDNVDQ